MMTSALGANIRDWTPADKAGHFQGTNKVELSFDEPEAFHPVYQKDYAILYTDKWKTNVNMTVEISGNYEPKQIKRTFKIDKDHDRIKLTKLDDIWGIEFGFFHKFKYFVIVGVDYKQKRVKFDQLSFHDPKGLVKFEEYKDPNYFYIRARNTGTTDVRINVHDDSKEKIIAYETFFLWSHFYNGFDYLVFLHIRVSI